MSDLKTAIEKYGERLSHDHALQFDNPIDQDWAKSSHCEAFKDALELLWPAVESLILPKELPPMTVIYDSPAKPGKTIFDVLDAQRDALTKLRETVEET